MRTLIATIAMLILSTGAWAGENISVRAVNPPRQGFTENTTINVEVKSRFTHKSLYVFVIDAEGNLILDYPRGWVGTKRKNVFPVRITPGDAKGTWTIGAYLFDDNVLVAGEAVTVEVQ